MDPKQVCYRMALGYNLNIKVAEKLAGQLTVPITLLKHLLGTLPCKVPG
jgi:hypothetical protein